MCTLYDINTNTLCGKEPYYTFKNVNLCIDHVMRCETCHNLATTGVNESKYTWQEKDYFSCNNTCVNCIDKHMKNTKCDICGDTYKYLPVLDEPIPYHFCDHMLVKCALD
jgi:hypothetical protein